MIMISSFLFNFISFCVIVIFFLTKLLTLGILFSTAVRAVVVAKLVILPTKYLCWWRCLEDVLNTSFVVVFRRRLQDALVKTNTFVLAIGLQDVFKTFSRRLQDVLQICLQGVFKIPSKRLAKTSSRRLQGVFRTCCKDIFKMFLRRIIKLNCSC